MATKSKPKPKTKTKTKTKTKPTKGIPIAFVRKLEGSFDSEAAQPQCARLDRLLAPLGAPRIGIAAAALLAHTKKGTPVARAHLKALTGDADAADVVVRYCATIPRGRGQMRGALFAVWPTATDGAALEGAYANFAKAYVEDPEVLAIGVAAATRLGETAALAERTAQLARATRLAPMVAALAGAAPARAKAVKELPALDVADRRHVLGRVLASTQSFDDAIAIEAAIVLANDPSIEDMTVSSAVVGMRHHGQDKLVEQWQARVRAGNPALAARIVQLFDYTATWATDDDHLEPFIEALWPISGRPEIFAKVASWLGSPNEFVREAVCHKWIGADEGRAAFDDAQIDQLARAVIALAATGDNTTDTRAANRALFGLGHPGARHAVMDAIRGGNPKANDKLLWSAYFALQASALPDVTAFFIERLFTERDEYWALAEAMTKRLDLDRHRAVVAGLVARAADPDAIRAATTYMDVLAREKLSPRFLVELGRAVIDWQGSAHDAGRLRHLFEEAALAAFATRSPDDARAFVARATAVAAKPYSDYHEVDRGNPTPARFTEPETKKLLAALASGALDRDLAAARSAAAAARAADKPIDADDARLGLLAGCDVSQRLLDDRARRVVWFLDQDRALHGYDGYEITTLAAAGIDATVLDGEPVKLAALFGDAAVSIDERCSFVSVKPFALRDVIRIGRTLIVYDTGGKNFWGHSELAMVGLRFTTADAAHEAVARFVANPPKGSKVADSWYVEGAGAVRREYMLAQPIGDERSVAIAVLGNEIAPRWDRDIGLTKRHPDHAAAVAAMQAWELGVFVAGGRIVKLWIDADATRREDTTLAAFFDDRYRTDTKDAAWHARAAVEMVAAIDEANLRSIVPDVTATCGPPASDAEIAAYQALVPQPLPEPLVQVWRHVGGFGFATATSTGRFLSPAELVETRETLRQTLRTWAAAHGRQGKGALEAADRLDTIAIVDGQPVTLFDITQSHDDNRCFTGPELGWWEKALGWQIATDLNVVLKRELERRVGDIYRLKLGERAGDAAKRTRLKKTDKTFEAICDGTQTMTRTLTANSPGKPSVKTHATEAAAAKFYAAAIAGAKAKGFK